MATLNIPEDLYRRIEARAQQAGHTPIDEAQELLRKALADDDAAEAALLAEVRAAREAHPDLYLTESELQRMKRWGRE